MTPGVGRPSLLVVATHPIQYQAPLFRALAASGQVDLSVAFLDLPDSERQGVGFGTRFAWDVPLRDGYESKQVSATIARGVLVDRWTGRRWNHPIRDLRESACDVVMVMGWNQLGLLQAWLSAKWCRLPLIVRGESNAKRPRVAWKRYLHRLLLSIPDRFVAIGASNLEFYTRLGISSSAINSAPYFVDNSFFASRAAAVDRIGRRVAWGIDQGDCCLLFAGKFEAKKRAFDLLEAVAALPSEVRGQLIVLMVGAGPLEASLRNLAEAADLRVTWTGFLNQTEIPAAYAAADVLILPSDHGETWGLVVNEAMACGVPAIVSDQVGCAEDLVRPGKTGLVYPMGDVAALAKSIETLASNPELRREMGEAARTVVTTEYTIQRTVDAIIDAVHSLTGRTRAHEKAGSV